MPTQNSENGSAKKIARKTLKLLLLSFMWLVVVGIIGGFFAGGVAVGYFTSLVNDDQVRHRDFIEEKIQENETTGFVYFNDDQLVGQLRSDEDRRLIALKDVPQTIKDAFIATEDRNFYEHYGVDPFGFVRAVKQKLLRESVQTGGSTITQQLARRVFLSLEQTDKRKAKEILLSLRLERILSKDEIFQAYLNKIPFGNGSSGYNVYGIKAAAKGIFDKDDLHKLNLAQAAYLAGLPQSPSEFSTFTGKGVFDREGFEKAINRQHIVLKSMLIDGKITQDQYDEALAFDIRASLAEPKEKAYATYPYLMIEAEQRAAKILLQLQNPRLTEQNLREKAYAEQIRDVSEHIRRNGYKIYTTIDQDIYDAMQEIAQNPDNFTPDSEKKGIEQIGAVMIDNKTGAMLGMIEGRDFYKEQLNHATQMERQPGSTMKPIAAYGPAIEMGAIQPATPIDDSPVVQPDGVKGFHIPENWNNNYHGLTSARKALNQSYNIPALKLFNDVVGINNAWDYAKKMGITTLVEDDYHARTGVIGGLTYGVTLEELTGAYTTFANKGIFFDPHMIRKIVDGEGNVVYEHKPKPVQVFSEETAFLVTDMLRTVITAGTAMDIRSKFKHYNKIATVGKTGSTQSDHDAWFAGYTPDITLGVWAGYDQPSPLITGQGTLRAKNIWALVMNKTVEIKPELFATKEFVKPDNVIKMTVSDVSGKLPNDLVRQTNHLITDWFAKKNIPSQVDDVLTEMNVIPFNHLNYIPNPATPQDMVQHKVLFKRQIPTKTVIDQIKNAFAKYPRSIPKKKNGALKQPEEYIPDDAGEEAPAEADPRVDDGQTPPALTEVKLEKKEGSAIISFKPNPQEDVVGYRLYRSINNEPFNKQAVAHSGEEPKFTDKLDPANIYAYYITAVDIVGNESPPSRIVATNENAVGQIVWPPADHDDGSQGQSQDMSGAPATPANLNVKERIGGVGVELTWDRNADSDNVRQYRVFYSSQQNGEYTLIGSTKGTRFEYISLPADGWYKVTAVNVNGESAPSAPVQFTSEQ